MAVVTKALRMDEKLKADIEAWARAERRPTNDLIVSILSEALASARQKIIKELSRHEARLTELDAVRAKAQGRQYWEIITVDEFETDELGRNWVDEEASAYREVLGQALEAGEMTEDEVDPGHPGGPTVTDLEEAYADCRENVEGLRRKFEALNEARTLKKDTLVEERDGKPFISSQGLRRIKHTCQVAKEDWRKIGGKFLYRYEEAWIARAEGREPLSKRALNKLRDWLESVEGE